MGKKSIKENKNIYQICREEQGLTRAAASQKMGCISADRIEKIESEKSMPHPDEIMLMAEAYKAPHLQNYYCSHECSIGQEYVPHVETSNLQKIALEVLHEINIISKEKERLVDISVDGMVSESELEDFVRIQYELEKLALTASTLQIWFRQHLLDDHLDQDRIKELRQKLMDADKR